MQHRGAWRRRGFAVAAIALTFAVVAPELATPVGAATSRVELAAKRRPRPARTEAQRKARVLAALRAKGWTKAAAMAKLKAAVLKSRGAIYTNTKPKPAGAGTGVGATKRQRQALRQAAAKRQAATALAAKQAPKPKKSSSLSLPFLVLLALLPFVLIGLYLLGADYLRRREPRGPSKRGGASLVITRVSDR